DALEFPGVGRAVVPLVAARRPLVGELVAHRLPAPAAVVGALDHLPEPGARLRGPDAPRVGRRRFHVVDLPAREVRAAHVPLLPRAVRLEEEGALAGADEDPDSGHDGLLFRGWIV